MNHIKVELDFISVEDRLPEDSVWIIAQTASPGFWLVVYRFKDTWWDSHGPENLPTGITLTHWAEIPKL